MPLTHEQRAKRREQIAEYCKTQSAEQAAGKFGVSMSTVKHACDEHGVIYVASSNRRKRNKEIAEFCKSHTAHDAVREFGLSYHTIVSACRENRVRALSGLCESASARSFVILKRLLDGESQATIAEDMTLTRQRVGQIATRAREAGFKINGRKR